MPVITTAPCEPVSQRSANLHLNPASPLTFVVEKADKTRNNTTNTPTLPLAITVTTTVDGVSVVENPPGLSTEQEAGVIIGCLLLLIITGVLLYIYCRRRSGKRSDGPISSGTPSPTSPRHNPGNGDRRWPSPGPAYPPAQPGNFDYPVVDEPEGHQNGADRGVQQEPGVPAEAPQPDSAESGPLNGGTTQSGVPQAAADEPEQGYQSQNMRNPAREEFRSQSQEEQPQTAQQPVENEAQHPAPPPPPPPPPPPAPAPAPAPAPPPATTVEQPPPLPHFPLQQPQSDEAATPHVTFVEVDAQQEARTEAVRQVEERTPAVFIEKVRRKKKKVHSPSDLRWHYRDAIHEMHRRGDEQAKRFFQEYLRRPAPPAPPTGTQHFFPNFPSPPPPYPEPSTAPFHYVRAPNNPPPRIESLAETQYNVEGSPGEREYGEIQGIAEAWAHVQDEQAQAANFPEWYSDVTYFINQIEWRATYIQRGHEHRASPRARRLHDAAREIIAYRDNRMRHFQQTAAARSGAVFEERKLSDERTTRWRRLFRFFGPNPPTQKDRRPPPRGTVSDKKRRRRGRQAGSGADYATQRPVGEAVAGTSGAYAEHVWQGVQNMGQAGDAAAQSSGIAGYQQGNGPLGTISEEQPVQQQGGPPFQPQPSMYGAYVAEEEEEEGQQNQAEATGIQSADGMNQQQQGDHGVEPQGTQEEAGVTVQYTDTDGVTVTHEAESHEQEGEDGNRNG